MDLTTPEGLAAYMRLTTDGDDWNRRAQEVLDANDGKYPSFWWETVIKSGLYNEVVPGGGITVVDIDSQGNTTNERTYNPVTWERTN